MKIHCLSDLHFEFQTPSMEGFFWDKLKESVERHSPDLAILAGDICPIDYLEETLLSFKTLYPRVVYVPGNHDFFGTKIVDSWVKIKEIATSTGVHTPHNTQVDLGPLKLYGGTLWYPSPQNALQAIGFIDYRKIWDSIPQISLENSRFLQGPPADIVVSHHFPTDESIHPRWAGQSNNIFFCAYADQTVKNWKKVKLWVHGHTHDPMDFVSRHGFRVYANPLGYPGEEANPDFWERLLVTV